MLLQGFLFGETAHVEIFAQFLQEGSKQLLHLFELGGLDMPDADTQVVWPHEIQERF
jgi:hypothetical protein